MPECFYWLLPNHQAPHFILVLYSTSTTYHVIRLPKFLDIRHKPHILHQCCPSEAAERAKQMRSILAKWQYQHSKHYWSTLSNSNISSYLQHSYQTTKLQASHFVLIEHSSSTHHTSQKLSDTVSCSPAFQEGFKLCWYLMLHLKLQAKQDEA